MADTREPNAAAVPAPPAEPTNVMAADNNMAGNTNAAPVYELCAQICDEMADRGPPEMAFAAAHCAAAIREAAPIAAPAEAPPAGPPREPTEEMLQAAYDIIPIAPGTETWAIGRYPHPDKLWRAMYDAAPAAHDEREPLGEPDAWLVTDTIGPSQVFSERPEPSEIPGGCLVALYSEERIDALRSERDALKAALRNEYIRSPSSGRMGCLRCDSSWTHPGPERHEPGCLAAPEDAP